MHANQLSIGLMHWAMPPTTGGVESHVSDLAVMLAGQGCRVTVMTGEPEAQKIDGVEILHIPHLSLSQGKSCLSPYQLDRNSLKQLLYEIIDARHIKVSQ